MGNLSVLLGRCIAIGIAAAPRVSLTAVVYLLPALLIVHSLRADEQVSQNRSPNVDRTSAPVKTVGLKEVNPPRDPARVDTIALVGGRLIDGRGGEPIENSIVLLRGNRILAAGPADSTAVPGGARRINVSDMSVVPGLIDSHFHSTNDVKTPARFLSHGVVALRDPGHPFRYYQEVMQTDQRMPRVFLSGGHLDGSPPIWPDQAVVVVDAGQARRAVNEHVDRGASAIKIYFRLPLECYLAVCTTANERGVPVTAHLELVDADDAIRAGVHGIEHVTSFGTALAESDEADRFKSAVGASPNARTEERYRLWASLHLDSSPRVQALLDLIVKNNVVVSPTLAVFERRPGDARTSAMHVDGFVKMLRFVGMCHKAGATIVAGSHTHVSHAESGWAYQRELELLVEAGLTPLEAIAAGTLNNARFFRAEDRLGTIEPGKAADLVLVAGNPAMDIRALYDIRHVMLNGSWATEAPAVRAAAPKD